MTFPTSEIWQALPEIYLTAALCVVLLFDLFFATRNPGRTATFTLLVLVVGAVLASRQVIADRQVILGGMYVVDRLSSLLKTGAFLFAAMALFYSRDYLARRGIQKGEYYILSLTALLGVLVLASAANMVTLYVGVELLSLSLYALVAFDRDSGIAAEAAMKYFVLGAIASGTLLYGMSILYGMTGTLDLGALTTRLGDAPGLGFTLAVTFIVAAIAFKFGAVPFHMWVPDVYQGAPTASAMMVATVPKLASFAMAFRFLAEGLMAQTAQWTQMLAILAVVSVIAGNLIAIAQTSLLRMLAYSAIANVGFILFGFVAGTGAGFSSALYYTIAYVLMTLAAFAIVLISSREGCEADQLEHYKGLHQRDPLLAGAMAAVMFSTAGVPPFVGFWAKLQVIQALLGGGHLALAITAVVASVVGAFYYLRVVWLMYFESPGEQPPLGRAPGLRLVLAINALAVLALGIVPEQLLALCRQVIPGG
ncbi:MAG TPA: NADH-quinone oxidoreductase subunit NuoN [Steroidobacteraceae bacterium]|nr:NADH-quinone oxidoreductase subunit NuoN [Steroidobacteraceae bacterium]